MRTNTRNKLTQIAKNNYGVIRACDVKRVGLSSRLLSRLKATGELTCISRGVYQLTEIDESVVTAPDYASIKSRVPDGVVCLISALYHHELTTEIPRVIDLAIDRNVAVPRIGYPRIRIYRMSSRPFRIGIEQMDIGGVAINIYCPEKTIADCFKYRNQLGLNLAVEALKKYLSGDAPKPALVFDMAKQCRVGSIIKPYLEALL